MKSLPTTPTRRLSNRMTFRGLTAYEWFGGYCDLVTRWLCGLRGHPWGPWYLEAEEMPHGPATRMCECCTAYEEKS